MGILSQRRKSFFLEGIVEVRVQQRLMKKELTLEDRVKNYLQKFPNYTAEIGVSNRIYGFWNIGNYYKRKHGYYGEYPPSFLERVFSLFPDCEKILHLFSGMVDTDIGVTFDINPELKPDVVGDVREILNHFKENQFDLITADPPYEEKDFKRYGCSPFSKKDALKDLHIICKPNGFLVWLDLMIPIFSKKEWHLIGYICLVCGTNRRVRIVSMFQNQNSNTIISGGDC